MEPITSIRTDVRTEVTTARTIKRTLELDRRRLLDKSGLSLNVQEIANKLKTKSAVTPEELSSLKNDLLTESKINDFMKVHGALRGLVREFTALDTKKQIIAAECLCNLALGDARSSQIIAKCVGSYLVPCLRSLNNDLVITCAWTIGNLAGSHERVCSILTEQGAVNTLIALLAETKVKEIEEAALYALIHIVYNVNDGLKPDSYISLLDILRTNRRDESSYHLLFLLSCNPTFHQTVNEEFIESLLSDFVQQSIMDEEENYSFTLIYILRSLANLCVNDSNSDFVIGITRNSRKHLNQIETVLMVKCNELLKTMFWLLGNIFNTCTKKNENTLFFKAISDKILMV